MPRGIAQYPHLPRKYAAGPGKLTCGDRIKLNCDCMYTMNKTSELPRDASVVKRTHEEHVMNAMFATSCYCSASPVGRNNCLPVGVAYLLTS